MQSETPCDTLYTGGNATQLVANPGYSLFFGSPGFAGVWKIRQKFISLLLWKPLSHTIERCPTECGQSVGHVPLSRMCRVCRQRRSTTRGFQLVAAVLALCTRSPLAAKTVHAQSSPDPPRTRSRRCACAEIARILHTYVRPCRYGNDGSGNTSSSVPDIALFFGSIRISQSHRGAEGSVSR